MTKAKNHAKLHKARTLALLSMPLCLLLISGCASNAPGPSTPIPPGAYDPQGILPSHQNHISAFVLDTGWHTGWAVPAKPFLQVAPVFRRWFAQDRELLIGWGNQQFYMAQHPGLFTGLSALFPSHSVVLIQGIRARRWRSQLLPRVRLFPVPLDRAHFERLVQYVLRALRFPLQADGFPKSMPWYTHGEFFRSRETYDAFHTCNTWTTQSLRYLGYPVSSSGVLFAGQVQSIVQSLPLSEHKSHAPAVKP